jgi:hypothetical protein
MLSKRDRVLWLLSSAAGLRLLSSPVLCGTFFASTALIGLLNLWNSTFPEYALLCNKKLSYLYTMLALSGISELALREDASLYLPSMVLNTALALYPLQQPRPAPADRFAERGPALRPV